MAWKWYPQGVFCICAICVLCHNVRDLDDVTKSIHNCCSSAVTWSNNPSVVVMDVNNIQPGTGVSPAGTTAPQPMFYQPTPSPADSGVMSPMTPMSNTGLNSSPEHLGTNFPPNDSQLPSYSDSASHCCCFTAKCNCWFSSHNCPRVVSLMQLHN